MSLVLKLNESRNGLEAIEVREDGRPLLEQITAESCQAVWDTHFALEHGAVNFYHADGRMQASFTKALTPYFQVQLIQRLQEKFLYCAFITTKAQNLAQKGKCYFDVLVCDASLPTCHEILPDEKFHDHCYSVFGINYSKDLSGVSGTAWRVVVETGCANPLKRLELANMLKEAYMCAYRERHKC